MARNSSDREDLMAEVVTLVPRVAFQIADSTTDIVAGRRTDGRWSIFLGGDPVYHFDDQHRLRRAFVDGLLYRSQGHTLARLTRQESDSATVLLRHDLNDSELAEFRFRLNQQLLHIMAALKQGRFSIIEAIPLESDFVPELARNLQQVLDRHCELSSVLKK